MPRFEPFRGIRFAPGRRPEDVTSPPYDVLDADDKAALVARSAENAVVIDLPDEADGPGRYEAAADTFERWQRDGVLVTDPEPSFTVHRMSFTDDEGRPAHTLGVIGALELEPPGSGILPHEHTTPKAKSDRLDLMRATQAQLSAVWVLSLTPGLSDLLAPDGDAPGRLDRRRRRGPHGVAGGRSRADRGHLGRGGRHAGRGGRRAPPLRDRAHLSRRGGRRRAGRLDDDLRGRAGGRPAHRAPDPPAALGRS